MGVTRQLQMEAGGFCRKGGPRLVCEQDFQCGVVRRAGQRRLRVAALALAEVVGAVVGDPGQHEGLSLVVQHHVLVLQDEDPESSELTHPCGCARVVLVIAGDEKAAMSGLEPRQRFDMQGKL